MTPIPAARAAELAGTTVERLYTWLTSGRIRLHPPPKSYRHTGKGKVIRRWVDLRQVKAEVRRSKVAETSRLHNAMPAVAETVAAQAAYLRVTLPRCLPVLFPGGVPDGLLDGLVARRPAAIKAFLAAGRASDFDDELAVPHAAFVCCRAMLAGEFRPWTGQMIGSRRKAVNA